MFDSLEVGKTSSFGEFNALRLHLGDELHRSGGGLQIHLDLLVHQNIDTHLPPSEEHLLWLRLNPCPWAQPPLWWVEAAEVHTAIQCTASSAEAKV